jgi:uncharacterized membrane protein YeaQ/YmgE (transglycosylase-associated protein family)
MNVFLWIVIGLVTGSTARKVMPGPAAGGIATALVIGIIGTMVGGLLATFTSGNTGGQVNFYALLMATNGALYPLFLYRCAAMRSRIPFRLPRELTELSTPALPSAIRLSGRAGHVPDVA